MGYAIPYHPQEVRIWHTDLGRWRNHRSDMRPDPHDVTERKVDVNRGGKAEKGLDDCTKASKGQKSKASVGRTKACIGLEFG